MVAIGACVTSYKIQHEALVAIDSKESPGKAVLSFTLVSHSPGELDRVCENSLLRARRMGFRGVAISPSFFFSTQDRKLFNKWKILDRGELARCLDHALRLGFQIIYKPHINTEKFVPWRAYFEVRPDSEYEKIVFEDFWAWISKRRIQILSSKIPIHILDATELETSMVKYPDLWVEHAKNLDQKRNELNMKANIRIGLVPNWGALEDLKVGDCRSYSRMYSAFDYIAPTLYGDWRGGLEPGFLQTRLKSLRSDLRSRYGCRLAEAVVKDIEQWGIAEFATGLKFDAIHDYGSDDKKTFSNYNAKQQAQYLNKRHQFYKQFLKDLKSISFKNSTTPVIFWTVGFFDPFGVSLPVSDSVLDASLSMELLNY